MALGREAISTVYNTLNTITSSRNDAAELNRQLSEMFNDENFQKFVRETVTGSDINKKLTDLYEWTNKLLQTVDSLENVTKRFAERQERLNG